MYMRGVSLCLIKMLFHFCSMNFAILNLIVSRFLRQVQDDDEIQEIKEDDDTMKAYMNYKVFASLFCGALVYFQVIHISLELFSYLQEKSVALQYAGKSTPRKDSIARYIPFSF